MADTTALLSTLIGGVSVLSSYYYIFGTKVRHGYIEHPFWMGIPRTIIIILMVFQVLAAVGFIVALTSWITTPPTGGILGRSKYNLTMILLGFLISAVIWPIATYHKNHALTSISLLTAAASTILLLAGSIEEDNPRWYIVLSLIMLNIVTVLGDGVIWNATYISKVRYDNGYFKSW
jgi:hypothetical protein